MTRTIGFLVFPGFNILDLSGPLAAFDTASRDCVPPPYRLRVISEHGGAVAKLCRAAGADRARR